MKKKSTLKKPICVLATLTLTASILIPATAMAEENNTSGSSFSLNSSSYLANTGWTGSGTNSVATSADGTGASNQSIFYNNENSYGYNWAYSDDMSGVQSSPGISFGWNWTNGYQGAGNFPVEIFRDNDRRNQDANHRTQMKNIDTSVTYSTADATGDYATGYTMFIHNTQWAGPETTPSYLVKVVTSTSANGTENTADGASTDASDTTNRDQPNVGNNTANSGSAAVTNSSTTDQTGNSGWGDWIDTVQLDGATWDIYRSSMNGMMTDGTNGMNGTMNNNTNTSNIFGTNREGSVYTFVRTQNTDTATLNLSDFVRDLLGRNELPTSGYYVSGVKFGTDVMSGSGKLTISNWNISAQ
ncbi:GH12 family glycosyl hydrolase domain-containing protein [Paenibacillus sp. Z6-24]